MSKQFSTMNTSTFTPQPPPPSTTTTFHANTNHLLHVKFHANRFQDNLLSKKLKQLNMEEMKTRLKYQRNSNDLILFLNECQKSTGYFAKMKSAGSYKFLIKPNNAANKNNNNNNNSIQLETFDCQSTEFCDFKQSFDQDFLIRSESFMKNKFDDNNNNNNRTNKNEENDDTIIASSSSSSSESIETDSNKYLNEDKIDKVPFFEQILESSSKNRSNSLSSSAKSSKSSKSSVSSSSSKAISSSSTSRSSNSSDSYSNSSESINDLMNIQTSTPTNFQNIKKIRPITANFYATKSRSLRSNFNSKSNFDWFTSNVNFNSGNSEPNNSDRSTNKKNSRSNNDRPKTAAISKTNINTNNNKFHLRNEFQSKSLCFALNTNANDIKDRCSIASNNIDINSLNSFRSRSNLLSLRCSSGSVFFNPNKETHKVIPLIKINMSRNLIKKKQMEIMTEYKNSNQIELMSNLRQIQENINSKVKQFANQN